MSALLAAANDTNVDLSSNVYPSISNVSVGAIIGTAVNILFIVAGVAAFFWLLIGGIQWIFAGGEKEATTKARQKITGALIGLAIVFSVYALVGIIQIVFGVSILKFTIPSINGV